MLARFLDTVIYLYVFNEIFRSNYPVEHMQFIINGSFYGIYYFSKFQLLFYKLQYYNKCLCEKLHPMICDVDSDNEVDNESGKFEFVFNNQVIQTADKCELDNVQVDEYDFVIYSENSKTTSGVTNQHVLDYKPKSDQVLQCEESNIKFILVELKLGDKTIKLDFKTDRYNYYMTNNVFDFKFILYFLNKHYLEDIKGVSCENYTINIIDPDVTQITLDVNDAILITLDGYEKNQSSGQYQVVN